jgi:SAM-dependent methyltransferase
VKLSQRVLDLGCGAGYFIYIAQLLGHDCVGLDTDEQTMFSEITQLLGVERVIWRIQPFVPLPPLNKKFDLITAYRICFNDHKGENLWGLAEWEFFLNDLAKHLAPNGRIWLEFNLERDGSFYTSGLRNFFLSQGAKIRGSRVLFNF